MASGWETLRKTYCNEEGPVGSTAQQQMIVDAFQSEIYVSNRMDVQSTPIYDTIAIAVGNPVNALTTSFFTNVGPASLKSIALTNMTQSQRLPAPEAFSIFAFRFRWAENIVMADFLNLYNVTCLEFFLGQKCYQRCPLWMVGAGGGPSGLATGNAINIYANGVPMREAMYKLAIPIVIENQMTFWAQLNGAGFNAAAANVGGTGIYIQLVLEGLYARGVQ